MKQSYHSRAWSPLLALLLVGLAGEAAAACRGSWAEGSTYQAGDTVNYGGATWTALVTHTAYAGAGWNPQSTPSLWRSGGSCSTTPQPTPVPTPAPTPAPSGIVCLFEHADYQGASTCFGVGSGNLPGGFNDKASSVRVQPGYMVDLFEHANFSGRGLTLLAAEANLGNRQFNDLVTSYRVAAAPAPTPTPVPAGGAVCFYENANYGGNSFCANEGAAEVPPGWNDIVSSVKVQAGYQVTLREHTGQGGLSTTLRADNTNLASIGFDNLLTSFTVARAGTPCTTNCGGDADVTAVAISNASGGVPVKGDALRLRLTVQSTSGGTFTLRPTLTSKRFNDFAGVALGQTSIVLAAGESRQIVLDAGPFLNDTALRKQYAIGRGDYRVEAVQIGLQDGRTLSDSSYSGRDFSVGGSNVVFNAVVYNQDYFNQIRETRSVSAYLTEAFTRASDVFTPSNPEATVGSYARYNGGFDQIENVRQLFHGIPGYNSAANTGLGHCERAAEYATQTLGLTRTWNPGSTPTHVDHHGFDLVVALDGAFGGGVACSWLNTQVSGLFSFDLSRNRSQIVAVHETGHVFGAPHCDPLQSYVMCAGEKHARYQNEGIFVWLKDSVDKMTKRFD